MISELDELLLILGREPDTSMGFHGVEAAQLDLALVLIVRRLVVVMVPSATGWGVRRYMVIVKDSNVQVDPVDELIVEVIIRETVGWKLW